MLTFSALLLAGCANLGAVPPTQLAGIDGIPCVGRVDPPHAGLVAVDNPALLHRALAASGKGRLCSGRVYRATRPLTVYRVWDGARGYTLHGSWWSFRRPQGPRQHYRKQHDICPAWSALDRMSSCKLKTGAQVVLGPGQSADCATMVLPKSAVNQVFIPNDGRHGILFVGNCSKGSPWP